MKRYWLVLIVLLLSACNISKYRNVDNFVAIEAQSTQTPAPTFTPSPIPSPTIDYQMTAVIAQQTSDEARRVNALVTAEFEQRIQEQLRITAEAEQRNFAVLGWTQTAALTSVPLTATQQVISDTQVAQSNAIAAAQLTATYGAPTQMIAIANAENSIRYKNINAIVGVVAPLVISVFAIGLLVFIFTRIPVQSTQAIEEPEDEKEETIIQTKTDHGNGHYSTTRNVIPCSPDQLTYIAQQLTQGLKTLAINQWEDKESFKDILRQKGTSKRDVIMNFRRWLMEKRETPLVFGTDDGQLAPTDDLFSLLIGWLEGKGLPADYEFDPTHSPEDDAVPNHAEIPVNSAIRMNNHTHDNGGGGSIPESTVA